MGKTVVKDGVIYVQDAWMVKQQNSGAETEMDAEHIADLLYQKREVPGAMCFWWHSHANMSVFWSGTDRDQINKLASNGLCVALVLNSKGEHKACVATGGSNPSMHEDDVAVTFEEVIDPVLKAAWDKEYDDNVEKPVYKPYVSNFHSSYSSYEDSGYNDDPSWFTTRRSLQERTAISEALDEANENSSEVIRLRLLQLDDQEVALLDALSHDEITKEVCDLIGLKFDPKLGLTSPIIDFPGVTVQLMIRDKLKEIDDEYDALRPRKDS